MPDPTIAEIEAALKVCERATPGPWEFRGGNDANGDSCDLLVAEVGKAAAGEDPEYAEVLFGNELPDGERASNWELCAIARSLLPRALRALKQRQEDTERLHKLQRLARGYGFGWTLRISSNGRGMRLHETSTVGAKTSVREAIDDFDETTADGVQAGGVG